MITRELKAWFQFGASRTSMGLKVIPGGQAQVDYGDAVLMICPDGYCSTNSTLLFLALPSSVLFEATGAKEPTPKALSLWEAI